jgi:hypothetical protein
MDGTHTPLRLISKAHAHEHAHTTKAAPTTERNPQEDRYLQCPNARMTENPDHSAGTEQTYEKVPAMNGV